MGEFLLFLLNINSRQHQAESKVLSNRQSAVLFCAQLHYALLSSFAHFFYSFLLLISFTLSLSKNDAQSAWIRQWRLQVFCTMALIMLKGWRMLIHQACLRAYMYQHRLRTAGKMSLQVDTSRRPVGVYVSTQTPGRGQNAAASWYIKAAADYECINNSTASRANHNKAEELSQ